MRWRPACAAGVVGLLAAGVAFGCRKGEAPAGNPAARGAAKSESPAPQQPSEPTAPLIRETAATDRAPYAGMKEPRDAAVDDRGRLWVADFGNARLRIFDASGGYLGGWGNRGNGTYELRDPCAVTIRGDDVYVADTSNHVGLIASGSEITSAQSAILVRYLTNGQRAFFVENPGSTGASQPHYSSVRVTGDNKIVVYDRTLGSPRTIGKEGSGPAEFAGPVGIAVSPSGSVYVADTRNRRIAVLSADGGFRRALKVPGWEGAAEPHVEIGAEEQVFVTDPNAAKVLELTSSGALRREWTSDDAGRAFARPTGLALDRKQGILYVVDSANNTVSKIVLAAAKKSSRNSTQLWKRIPYRSPGSTPAAMTVSAARSARAFRSK